MSYYKEKALEYANSTNDVKFSKAIFESPILQQIISESSYALDIGCGSGRDVKYLNDIGLMTDGVDYSDGMIDYCLENHSGIQFSTMNISEEMPEYGKYDFMYSIGCFHHLNETELVKCLFNIEKSIKPQSYLYFTTKNITKKTIDNNGRVFYPYQPVKLVELLGKLKRVESVKITQQNDLTRNDTVWNNILVKFA